ncbi:MAG: hypothetical protein DWH98_05440 [Planctomycetota bacterium]|nr:MAG: hypothetical protein DWH98_05440 [Planctomycetota bacterium]
MRIAVALLWPGQWPKAPSEAAFFPIRSVLIIVRPFEIGCSGVRGREKRLGEKKRMRGSLPVKGFGLQAAFIRVECVRLITGTIVRARLCRHTDLAKVAARLE